MKINIDKSLPFSYTVFMLSRHDSVKSFRYCGASQKPSKAYIGKTIEALTVERLPGLLLSGRLKLCLIQGERTSATEKNRKKPMFKALTFCGYPLSKTLRQKHGRVGKIGKRELGEAEMDSNPSADDDNVFRSYSQQRRPESREPRHEAMFYPGEALSICQTDSCK
jgi:hypothetical protein